jgi:transposase-like protein
MIGLVVMMYTSNSCRFAISRICGRARIAVNHETVRIWRSRVGRRVATQLRKWSVAHMPGYPQRQGRLDDAFVKMNAQRWFLLRAVNHERTCVLDAAAGRVKNVSDAWVAADGCLLHCPW